MGVHNFVKVGNFWWRSIQWFCLLWAPQEFQNMFSCGSQIIVGTWIILVAWLKKIKKNTLHGFNPRYTDIDLWQDPRICIFNKQPGNSATSGLEASTMPHGCSWLRHSPLLPPSLIRYPDIVLRTKEIKVLLGSPSLLVISLMPWRKNMIVIIIKSATIYWALTQFRLFLITIILQGCYHQPHLGKEEIGLANNIKPLRCSITFSKTFKTQKKLYNFSTTHCPTHAWENWV